MKLFNHVQIKVQDLEKSRSFWDSVMDVLGYCSVLEIKDTVIGYGTSVYDMFEIRQVMSETPLTKSLHLAFNAPSLQSVDKFYQTALENGGRCNGKPGFRPEYEEGYYAAFIIDTDGHNVEAVYVDGHTNTYG